MEDRAKILLINMIGIILLSGLTILIYLETNEALIFVIGGLILVFLVLGTTMR